MNENEIVYKCEICGAITNIKEWYERHIKLPHPTEDEV